MRPLAFASEEDVIAAFRQVIAEELSQIQSGRVHKRMETVAEEAGMEEALRCLAGQVDELEHEVALLRTIVLRLVSEPVDGSNEVQDKVPTA